MPSPPLRRCPCDSGHPYASCCGPYHDGTAAPSPEALMRSRYAAYALGRADYIMATTHPASPHREADVGAWRAGILRFSAGTVFAGLTVRSASTTGDRGIVEFEARLRQGGRDATMFERSVFHRVGGRWMYDTAEVMGR